MIDPDRLQADADEAAIRGEMARTALLLALASRDALVKRWNDTHGGLRDLQHLPTPSRTDETNHPVAWA